MVKEFRMVRIRTEPTWRRLQAEKLIREDCSSLDGALESIFKEIDQYRKGKKRKIEDIFHL